MVNNNNPRVDQIIIIMCLRCSTRMVTTLQKKNGNLILLPNCNAFGGQGEIALERFGVEVPKELRKYTLFK